MATEGNLAYAASGKYIGAFDVANGQSVWSVKVPGGWFSSGILSIAVIGDTLVAGKDGAVFGYDRHTGELIWRNRLQGSSAYATIVAGGSSGAAVASSCAASEAASAVAIIAATSASTS